MNTEDPWEHWGSHVLDYWTDHTERALRGIQNIAPEDLADYIAANPGPAQNLTATLSRIVALGVDAGDLLTQIGGPDEPPR